jgi:uncharacterized membrane protein
MPTDRDCWSQGREDSRSMAVISDHVDINAAAGDVWAVLSDVRGLPNYSASTIAVEHAPACLDAEGQTFVQVVKLLGKEFRSKWTVLEYDEGKLLRTEGKVGPGVRLGLSQRLEVRSEDQTRLKLEIRYQVPGGALGRFVSKGGLEKRAKKEAASVLAGIKSAAQAKAA